MSKKMGGLNMGHLFAIQHSAIRKEVAIFGVGASGFIKSSGNSSKYSEGVLELGKIIYKPVDFRAKDMNFRNGNII